MLKSQLKYDILLDSLGHTDGTLLQPSPRCIAPFLCLTIDPNGDVFTDSVYRLALGNLHEQSLKEIWEGDTWKQLRQDQIDRKINPGCVDCANKDKMIGHSRRRFYDTFFMYRMPRNQMEPITDDQGWNLTLRPKVTDYNNPNFLYLDISTSNKCNLKCVHCRGAVSTGWIPDEKKLQKSDIKDLRMNRFGVYSMETDVIDKIFQFPEYFKNLRYVALRGGEPTYEAKNKIILKKLIDLGWNSQITIDISTNATVNDEEFMDLLGQFESVMLYISIEGVGEMYEYCRGGKQYKIDDLEKMIFKYANLRNNEICVTFTSMATNIFNIRATWDWLQKYRDYCTFSFSNTVSQPEYLSLGALNNEMRKEAYDMIQDIHEDMPWPGEFNRSYQAGIDKLKVNLNKPELPNWQTYFNNFKRYITAIDKVRNTDFLEIEPTYRKFWEIK